MKSYVDLIKEGIIDFKSLLLEKYYLLSLSEKETLLLLRLYERSKNTNTLLISELAKKMTIKEDEIGNVITGLVTKGFVNLSICDENNSFIEEFSLEDTYHELAYLLENDDQRMEKNDQSLKMKSIAKKVELICNKQLSPFEFEIIRKWIYDYRYDITAIEEAIVKVSKLKKPSPELIDRTLYADANSDVTTDDIKKTQELLQKKYGKIG